MEKFKQLGISEQTLKVIEELGFEEPTEIQEKSIPLVLEGNDVIAGASTGSGKTLAFGVGVINHSKPDFGVQGLILTPTRELAGQITKELKKFTGDKKLNVVSIYGGMSMNRQIEELESAEIVIGTPGRLLDHLSRRTLNLQYVKTLVLDEADRMFDMGFRDDVEKIISQCPKDRQTLLYSATISSEVIALSEKYMINPIEVSAEVHVNPDKLSQIYYDIEDGLKFSLLKYLLENEKSELVMVFCNTRRNVDFVANNLQAMNMEVLPIHGGYSQDKRNRIMEKFHSSKVHVLVCTDVAARGLDIKGVSHVYNYDIPKEAKEYVHRIGRTARAGKEGKVINIITSRDYDNFSGVLKHNPDFKIKNEVAPRVPKVMLKWMDKRSGPRGRPRTGNYRGNSRGPRRDSRGPRRDSRDSGGRDSRPRTGDRRPRGNSRPRSNYRSSDRRDSSGRDSRPRSNYRNSDRRDSRPRIDSGDSRRRDSAPRRTNRSASRRDTKPRSDNRSYSRRSSSPRGDSRPRRDSRRNDRRDTRPRRDNRSSNRRPRR